MEGKYHHLRSKCKSYQCGICGPYKIRRIRKRIVELAVKNGLQRFLTLTLDPLKLDPSWDLLAQIAYLKKCWRKMRVYIKRKLGHSVEFIGVVELQKNGRPHLHFLLGSYLNQSWISAAWQAVGGGKIVDIRWVEIRRVAAYLAKYITDEDLCDYPRGMRRFSASRGFALFEKAISKGWRFLKTAIEVLHANCTGLEIDCRDLAGLLVSFISTDPPLEIFSQQARFKVANRFTEANYVLRGGNRTLRRAGLRFSPLTRSLEYQPAMAVPGADYGL